MSEKKLSIVIPMYDSEEFIARTLNSIFESNLPEDLYNVLVVDDGSKDDGPTIVAEMGKKHPNLNIITQENGGSSKARNTGIELTREDYIWFIDSDDVVPNDLSAVTNALNNNELIDVYDFVFEWCYNIGERQGIGVTHPTVPHDVIIGGREAIIKGYVPGSVCALLIRHDFLLDKKLRFKTGITQQDVEFTYRMMAVAKKVLFKNEIIYNYVIRKGSISHTRTGEKWIKYQSDKVVIIDSFYQLADSLKSKDKELSRRIHDHADGALFGCVYNLYKKKKKWKGNGVNEAVLTKLKEHKFYPLHLPLRNFKRWAMSLILNHEFLLK